MQAQGFRSNRELGLTVREYLALQKVYTAFMLDEIKWFDRNNVSGALYRIDLRVRYPFKGYFNMACSEDNVKGYGCVGDLSDIILFLTRQEMYLNPLLNELLFPGDIDRMDLIKPDMAARAIYNYLTYGEPSWKKCVPPHVYMGRKRYSALRTNEYERWWSWSSS